MPKLIVPMLALMACICLCSCSSKSPGARGHARHRLGGSLPHVGDGVPVALSLDRPVKVTFPMNVRHVYAEDEPTYTIAKKDFRTLLIKAETSLPPQGIAVRVMLWTGHQYQLRLLSESPEFPFRSIVEINPAVP